MLALCCTFVLLGGRFDANAKDLIKNHQLYYQQDSRVPMTTLALGYHGAGAQQESEDLAGLARMTAKMLFRGTPSIDRESLERKLELLGADVNADVSETDFTITISCFTKNLDEVLTLVAMVIREAGFPESEIELVRKQELNGLEAALQNADGVLSKAHEYVLFDGTRFGRFGSRAAIARVARKDIQEFFSHVRGAKVLYFTAISNLPKDEIEKKLKVFTDGRRGDGFVLKPEVPFRTSQGRDAVIFNSPGATNDRLLWSHKGIDATDDRRFDLDLIVDALGSSQGYLFNELRGKKGWCYGAYAFLARGTGRTGRVIYYSDPTSENSDKLIPEMLRMIGSFGEETQFQDLLALRNETFKNRYAYQLDVRFKLTSEVNRDRYGIPILDKESYYKRIDDVNAQTADTVIDEVFDSENITMVFYGDAERIKNILTGYDPTIKIKVLEKEVLVQ